MGQRLAPVLAIAYMSKIERPVMKRKSLLYCRGIDDCFIVCPTRSEMDACFELLNNQAEHIKLTREKPTSHWLQSSTWKFVSLGTPSKLGIPANLKTQQVRNRLFDCACERPSCVVCPFGREGDCRVSGAVYLTTCIECKEEYIGDTGGLLWEKVDIAARKALEALWIEFKNPAINRKEEWVAITQELASFFDLCEHDPGGHQPEEH
ncbi:unnamed protein product [Heligmosomoides polygyrus]|uniref:Reverse transcriptase domain-containing protein n=1 Tax=Heligmosomoides polygyrus TaxID=6339 RepID=A0A183G6L8_HELPZ|nr:unnamed protein product [Heligmosomoides polygyrus]